MESKNYKFSKAKSEGLSYLWINGKRVAATGTIQQLLDCGALLKAPKNVDTALHIILDIAKGAEKQDVRVYLDGGAARLAMLDKYARDYATYVNINENYGGCGESATLRDMRESIEALGYALPEDGLKEGRDYKLKQYKR